MTQIRQAIQNQRVKREELLNRYTDKHPDVIACDRQIRDLQAQLKNEVVNAYHVEQEQLEQIHAKVKSLDTEVAMARQSIDELTGKETELRKIDEQISTLQDKYELLLRKRDEAHIAIASAPEWDVTILQPANTAWPQRTSDYVRLALGPLLSLVVGLGLAFFVEGMDHSIKNSAEAEEYLGKPVLATFRELKDKKKRAA
jgi:succinoglycan biosynthesis transport protein ExoP